MNILGSGGHRRPAEIHQPPGDKIEPRLVNGGLVRTSRFQKDTVHPTLPLNACRKGPQSGRHFPPPQMFLQEFGQYGILFFLGSASRSDVFFQEPNLGTGRTLEAFEGTLHSATSCHYHAYYCTCASSQLCGALLKYGTRGHTSQALLHRLSSFHTKLQVSSTERNRAFVAASVASLLVQLI